MDKKGNKVLTLDGASIIMVVAIDKVSNVKGVVIMRLHLQNTRRSKNISVGEMASQLKISKSYYYKIEQGVRNPTLELARKIAGILGEPVDKIFFGNELDRTSKTGRNQALTATGTES